MNTLEEILAETRKDSKLCAAIESGNILCYIKAHSKGLCQKHYDRLKYYGSLDIPPKIKKKCRFIDCENKYFCKGYCQKHYKRAKTKYTIKCCVEKCTNMARAQTHKLCSTHLLRLKKHGDINTVKKSGFNKGYIPPWTNTFLHEKCIVPGCNIKRGDKKRGIIKGLCSKHHSRWRRYGDYNIVNQRGAKGINHGREMDTKNAHEKGCTA